MPANGEDLSGKQERCIAALLSEASDEAAARKAGVTDRTLRRWRQEPFFRAAELASRRAVVERAQTLVQQLTTTAALALHRNLTCGKPGVEVRAAAVVFDLAAKAVEMQELLQRVEELESRLGEE
jgi:hypothetical protein